jgi:hypothetical protein
VAWRERRKRLGRHREEVGLFIPDSQQDDITQVIVHMAKGVLVDKQYRGAPSHFAADHQLESNPIPILNAWSEGQTVSTAMY